MICPSCGHDNVPGTDACVRCLTDLALLDLPVGHDRVERSLMVTAVRALDPPTAITIGLSDTLGEALDRMTALDIGALLVVDDGGRLRGILTERDFLTEVALIPDYTGLPVSQFMTPDPETVSPSDTLAFALRKMDVGGYRHLPVVQEGMPTGMISVRDVIRHITELCRH